MRRAAKANGSTKAGSRKPRRVRNTLLGSAGLLDLVKLSLDDDQAEDIAVIDLAGKTAMADFMVVCSGRNSRHISAMTENLKEKIKTAGLPSPPTEGQNQAEWVLMDGGDVIIHLFRPEARLRYKLEKMWGGIWTEDGSAEDDTPEDAGEDKAGNDSPPD
jgi:ribosome-associated protein